MASSVNLLLERESLDLILQSLETHIKNLKVELEDYLDFTPEKNEVQDEIDQANDLIAYLMQM